MAFDIDRYTANSKPVAWGDLDLDSFHDTPLPPESLRTLRAVLKFWYSAHLGDKLRWAELGLEPAPSRRQLGHLLPLTRPGPPRVGTGVAAARTRRTRRTSASCLAWAAVF